MLAEHGSSHTQWSDPAVEQVFLDALSLETPWPLVERFSQLTRLSGSEDEEQAIKLLTDHLDAWGVPYTLHHPTCFISIPLQAAVRALEGQSTGTTFHAKTSAMSVSTDGEELEGELTYVPATTGGSAGDVISASVDLGAIDVRGKIVITDGLPFPGMVAAVTEAGASGGIFVSPGHNIHETICTPIWGTPDLDSADSRPTLPVAAVNRQDGDALIEIAKAHGRVSVSTKLDTRWREVPVLVAEIPGTTRPDEFVLLHGHVDSWHVGVGDNATGDAAMLEIASVAWQMREHLDRSLRVAWWSGHSHGRYAGSTWYADAYAMDLAQHCIAQVNCDSPGCRWASTFNDLSAMSETEPLVHTVVEHVSGITPKTERPPRAGDYSFNNIGISSCFMLSSTMSDSDREAKGYYPVGGCGGNIAWHTEDDTLEIADRDNLLRDMRVYAASLLRMLNAPVHPVDWRRTVAEFARTLDRYQAAAGGTFDFGATRSVLGDLDAKLTRFYDNAMRSDLDRKHLDSINAVQRRLGRILIPINFSRMAPFKHDPALNVPPLPDLAAALSVPDFVADNDRRNMVKAHLLRGQNRVHWALTLARETVDRSLSDLSL